MLTLASVMMRPVPPSVHELPLPSSALSQLYRLLLYSLLELAESLSELASLLRSPHLLWRQPQAHPEVQLPMNSARPG